MSAVFTLIGDIFAAIAGSLVKQKRKMVENLKIKHTVSIIILGAFV
ncbi:hypothetical protein [Pseudalkalibacillus sp. NRS-1564]